MALLGFFRKQNDGHPLANPKAAEAALASLAREEPEKVVREVSDWLESLQLADGISPQRAYELVMALDEAGASHARRYTRTYLSSARNRSQEFRLWQSGQSYWQDLVAAYEVNLTENKGAKPLSVVPKAERALFLARLLNAYGGLLKWDQFRYGPVDGKLWRRAGAAYLLGDRLEICDQPVKLYASGPETTVAREYLRLLVFQALSMGCLLPLEIELAERLIDHVMPLLSLSQKSGPDSVFWVDAAKPIPPTRLVRIPRHVPTMRYFGTGAAFNSIETLRLQIDLTGEVPPELALGGSYPASLVVKVLAHLALGCAPKPVQRSFKRLPVKNLVTVVFGLDEIRLRVGGDPGQQEGETWVTEDVSRGGMGAQISLPASEELQVGAILGFCPEGGSNWLIGVVRRFNRDSETSGSAGLETLSLTPRLAILERSGSTLNALVLDQNVAVGEEIRIATAHNEWEPYATSILEIGDLDVKVRPLEAIEQGRGYVVGRYRVEPVRYTAENS